MSYMPVRGGTRGGKDQFQWDDVKADKHRESYLGHSVMAPVGRWQKGKDLSWYTKKSKAMGQKEILKAEIAVVKSAEAEAMAAALGLKPKSVAGGSISKQELAEVCRRQSVEEKEEEGQEERMKGLGYMNRRLSHLHSNQAAPTGAAMFESNPVHEEESRGTVDSDRGRPPPSLPTPHLPPSKATLHQKMKDSAWVERAIAAIRSSTGKEKKKKRKKDKSRKKLKKSSSRSSRKRHKASSSSESEEESGQRQRKRNENSSGSESESDSEEWKRKRRRQHDGKGEEDKHVRSRKRVPSPDDSSSGSDGGSDKRRRKERRKQDERRQEDEDDRRRARHSRGREETRRGKKSTRHRHDSPSD